MNHRTKRLLAFLDINPNDVFTLYALGLEYRSQTEFNAAIDYFKRCIEIDHLYLAAYYQLAEIFILISNPKEALYYIQLGIDICKKTNDIKTQGEFNALLYELEV
jgi:tetratricopeptide (TPR) repeat protein